jgi:serine/threonine-protein kinase
VIHRDIKPQNILIGYDPSGLRVRICDFGLAKRVNPLTLAATAAGTVSFKAPEVFSDEKADSTAADVWSVGVLLYLLLVDRFPYADAEGHAPRAGQRFMPPFDPPSRFNCMVDPVLDGIVERALALKPKARYQSAGEVLEALMAWQPAVKGQKSRAAQALASDSSTKTVLGNAATSQNAGEAQRMAKQALKMAQQASQLQNAADLMEEAFNKWPELRSRYVGKVKLWRCGVVTPMQTDV